MAEPRVVVERDLAVEGDDLALLCQNERVDLDEGCVLPRVHVPQLEQDGHDLLARLGVEARGADDLARLRLVDSDIRVDDDLGQRLRTFLREGFDVHASLDRAHGEASALGPVEQRREVELSGDVRAGGDEHAADLMALDVHSQNFFGPVCGLLRASGEFHAPGLASAARFDLRFDNDEAAAELAGGRLRLLRSRCDDPRQHGHSVCLE